MKPASWVICDKATGRAVLETYAPEVVAALNVEKYEALPVQTYLARLNAEIKSGHFGAPT
jgi:hypothetical protein